MLPLKLFSQSLGLLFVFTTIYKQHNHRLNTPQSFVVVEGFDGTINEEDWRNIIKHDSQKSKRRESIIRYKSCSVVFKSLLKFSGTISKEQIHQESDSFFITVLLIWREFKYFFIVLYRWIYASKYRFKGCF